MKQTTHMIAYDFGASASTRCNQKTRMVFVGKNHLKNFWSSVTCKNCLRTKKK